MSEFINGDRVSVNGLPATVYDVNNGSMQVILDGQKSWIRVAISSVSKLATEPTFKKGDAVLLELPEGSGIGWISGDHGGGLYTVSLHMGHKCSKQLANGHYRAYEAQLTKLSEIPFPQQSGVEIGKSDDKQSVLHFLDTCTKEQLLAFIDLTEEAGSMKIVRKAIKAWVALAKEASQ
jgi:hypothetical protein